MDFEITNFDSGRWLVVQPSGEIDMVNAPTLRAALVDFDRPDIIVDLTGVEFIDSTGLGVLVGAAARARKRDGELRVVCPRPGIRKVFAITGLDAVFAIAADLNEASAD
jgi:anti-sigma B factor antagonist